MEDRIVRIVRMTFILELIPEFLTLFEERSNAIRDFPGCERLELIRSLDSPECFVTVSVWRTESDLEAYRASDFFRETWSRTRAMFEAQPEAESFTISSVVEVTGQT